MLAQNFKTVDELNIPAKLRTSLITVLGMLERGELSHAKADPDWSDCRGGDFNMGCWSSRYECGTIRCIGGWAQHIGKIPAALIDQALDSRNLAHLFYPCVVQKDVTTDQAATALRNYLTTGKPRWEEIITP